MKLRIIPLIILTFLLANCSYSSKYQEQPVFYSYVIGDVNPATKPSKEYNSKAFVTIASCQKIITALLAYKSLGVDYHYQTELYVSKNRDQIKDVVLHFVGDPTLKSKDLLTLLEPLKGAKISGKIIIDASKFQVPPLSNNLMKYDIGKDYAQPVSAMIIDKNLINVMIKTGKIGKAATVENNLGYKIDASDLIVGEANGKNNINLEIDNQIIKAYGDIASNPNPLKMQMSPAEIDDYILRKLKPIFDQLNLKSKIVIIHNRLKLPSHLELINSHQSAALKEFLPPALKKSDNLVFDSLYLNIIDANKTSEIKDWPDGDIIFKSLIKKYFDIDMDGALIVDGSGLSRYNHIQTYSIFELLRKGYDQKEFVTSLSSPGEIDSTLEKRPNLPKNIRAKTGSLYGVGCLCGYKVNNDDAKAFVIINNNFSPAVTKITAIQDQFVNDNFGN
jgi:D-alanyl-D-alanine carboxypeptidase/D-alanyl-D-alanine-endopeptidase (penicillin-binding protein 4)